MKIEDQGANFMAVRDYAESLGFSIGTWLIKESPDGQGCECKMSMSARDSDILNLTENLTAENQVAETEVLA